MSREEILSAIVNALERLYPTLKQQYPSIGKPWLNDNTFSWIEPWMKQLASPTKGKVARALVVELLEELFNIPVEKKGVSLIHKNKKLSPKYSSLWKKSGRYRFQQIKRDFDYYCFLGLSPHKIHLWVLPQTAYKRLESQHSAESRWISVNPQRQDDGAITFSDYGGDLETLPPNAFNFVK